MPEAASADSTLRGPTTMRAPRCFRSQLVLFTALTAADLWLTWRLLTHGSAAVYESNPLAAWFLGHHGWAGLTVFKVGTALLTSASALVVSYRRPRAGCGVLAVGSAILAGVVAYSSVLLGLAREFGEDMRAFEAAEAEEWLTDQDRQKAADYNALKGRLTHELAVGRRTLPEIVDHLHGTERARDRAWVSFMRQLYGL